MIHDIVGFYPRGAQFVALLGQRGRRTGLEGKMIEAVGDTEPAVDAGIIFCRQLRNSFGSRKAIS